jgi:uncharacterized protein (TIGR02271 family)
MSHDEPTRRTEADDAVYVVRHDEEPETTTRWRRQGVLRARRLTDTAEVRALLARDVEAAAVERVPAGRDDSGEIEELDDGSISIPMFEEELVVTKRIVLRERLVIRKEVVTEEETVADVLRRERVVLEADEGVEIVDETVEETEAIADEVSDASFGGSG